MTDLNVFYVRFDIKEGKEEEFLGYLREVIEAMKHESSFVSATLHRDIDNPSVLVLHEVWKGTRESFFAEERPRPYREEYERQVKLLLHSRTAIWLTPIATWDS